MKYYFRTPLEKLRHINLSFIIVVLVIAAVGAKLLLSAHAQTTQVAVLPTGTTYASAQTPQADQSGNTLLRTNNSPIRKSYLKFTLASNFNYSSAVFKVYANQNSSQGFTLYSTDNNWSPKNVTYTNQPALGAKIGTSGPITKDSWVSVNVSSAVKTAGTYSFVMVANDNTAVTYNSVNASTNRPQLDVQYSTTVTPPPPPPGNSVVRAAFYYPWFPNAWNQQGFDPFTNYHPSLGFYSSSDANVIKTHIAAMQYGHLDAGIISWWGQGSQEDSVVPLDLAAANGTGFKWSLYYENEGTNITSESQIKSDLSYIKTKYASNPNFLTINGKPVIFVYGQGSDNCSNYAAPWQQANSDGSFYVILKVFSGYQSCTGDAQGWHQYGPASAEDQQQGYSFSISPGFNKKGESGPRLVRNLATWDQNVKDMVASKEPLQLITTFNEWGEGTAVESAQEWNSASGFGSYLDILHNDIPAASTTGDKTPPTAPQALTATAASSSIVNLNWGPSTDNVGVAGYYVYRGTTLLATVDANTRTYMDTSVKASTTYSYTIKAFDAANNISSPSNTASVTTPASVSTDKTPPTAPTGLTATAANSAQVSLKWNASTDNVGVTGYNVYRDGTELPTTSGNNNLQYTDTTVQASTKYTYTVKAFDAAGNLSSVSNSAVITTPPNNDKIPPTAPTNVKVVATTGTSSTITWGASTDSAGVAGYYVYRAGALVAQSTGAALSAVDTTVVRGGTYSYTVKAFDIVNNLSMASTPVSFTMPAAPTAPTKLAASSSSPTSVSLAWTAGSDPVTINRYNIVRNGTVIGTTTNATTSYTDTSAQPSTNYSYQVAAVDSLGTESPLSNTATVTTGSGVSDTTPPTAPSGLTATAPTTSQVNLSWKASTDNVGVTGYDVYRSTTLLQKVSGTTLSYADISVSPSTTYSYTVKAFDAAGNVSIASNTATVTTPSGVTTGGNSFCGLTSTPPTTYKHVIWIWMENKTYSQVIGSSSAPYETQLAKDCATDPSEIDTSPAPPDSLPNYIAGTAGVCSSGSITATCPSSADNDCTYSASSCHAPVDNIFREVRANGGTERSFEESMPSNCYANNSGNYAVRHDPAVYFDAGTDRAACLVNDVPMGTTSSGNFLNALATDATLPTFSFITPNVCNDTHDCTDVGVGDTWLKSWVPLITNSPAYKSGDTALFINWDEYNPSPNIYIAPSIKPGTVVNDGSISHYSVLRSTEEMLGINTLLGHASTAPDMRAAFNF
jgi:chitodextrinase